MWGIWKVTDDDLLTVRLGKGARIKGERKGLVPF